MTTLYIRDVSDEVAAVLKKRAAAGGMSLSAYVAAELTKVAKRPSNLDVIAELKAMDRSNGPTTEEIVEIIRKGRGE